MAKGETQTKASIKDTTTSFGHLANTLDRYTTTMRIEPFPRLTLFATECLGWPRAVFVGRRAIRAVLHAASRRPVIFAG